MRVWETVMMPPAFRSSSTQQVVAADALPVASGYLSQTSPSIAATESSEETIAFIGDLFRRLAMSLAAYPNRVNVQIETTGEETILHLFVAPEDMGRLVGKEGRMAKSLRGLLGAIGQKNRHRFSLDIIEIK